MVEYIIDNGNILIPGWNSEYGMGTGTLFTLSGHADSVVA